MLGEPESGALTLTSIVAPSVVSANKFVSLETTSLNAWPLSYVTVKVKDSSTLVVILEIFPFVSSYVVPTPFPPIVISLTCSSEMTEMS